MANLEMRTAVPDDAEDIAQLVNRAYRPASGAEGGWTHEASLVSGDRINVNSVRSTLQDTTILVGVTDSEIVGCVRIELQDRTAYIGMLAVDPSLQASGVGKFLLAGAEANSVSSLRAEEAVLIVIAARKELVEFYLRRGYRKSDEKLQYPVGAGVGVPTENAMDLTVLKKDLKTGRFNNCLSAASKTSRGF